MAIDGLPGLTVIEISSGAVTVNVAAPLIVPEVAVIEADPFATLVASPPLLTVATAFAEDDQIAVLVRFCFVPLLYVPVALNCWVFPAATEAIFGVTAIELRTEPVTANAADPAILPDVAVIVAVPCNKPVANPV